MSRKQHEEARKRHLARNEAILDATTQELGPALERLADEQQAGPAPVFCVDCEHCTVIAEVQFFCGATTSLVTGKKMSTECYIARRPGEQCGPEAWLFKRRAG